MSSVGVMRLVIRWMEEILHDFETDLCHLVTTHHAPCLTLVLSLAKLGWIMQDNRQPVSGVARRRSMLSSRRRVANM